MKVAEAVTDISAGPIWTSFAILVVVYALIAWAFVGVLLRMRIRWRRAGRRRGAGRRPPDAPAAGRASRTRSRHDQRRPGRPGPAAGVAAYACGGGADFGAGFWDLLAGDKDRGARPRALVDYAMAPVWEANNVWLVFVLVVTWTGFPPVFEAVMSTTWVAVILAALGLVLRGAAFAIRKPTHRVARRRRYGVVFGIASIVDAVLPRRGARRRRVRPRPGGQPRRATR